MKKIERLVRKKIRVHKIRKCLAGRFNERQALVQTSSPRSGSTWLSAALGSLPKSCVLFEPLHLRQVPQAKAAGFFWSTYVAPDDKWNQGEAFLKRVFEGRVVNEWTSREMSHPDVCQSETMIVKFVRANKLLPWLCNTFALPPPVLLIRHPCAVVASQMNSELDWNNPQRPEPPPFIKKYPGFLAALGLAEGTEEVLAATWALEQLVPLMQATPHPWITVTYEELLLQSEVALRKILRRLNHEEELETVLSSMKNQSSMTYKSGISGIDGWKRQLTQNQIAKILTTVERFGLRFYSKALEPDLDVLTDERLPEIIIRTGTG